MSLLSTIPIDPKSGLPMPAILMARAANLFPTQRRLAQRLGITGSHVSRILKGVCGIGPDLCLRLADVLGESRAAVLRQCGHAKFAERVYPKGDPEPVRSRLGDIIERLSKHDQRLISVLAERLSSATPGGSR